MINVVVLTPTPSGLVKADMRQIVDEEGALKEDRILNRATDQFYPGRIYGVAVAAGIENRSDGGYIVDCPKNFANAVYGSIVCSISRSITDYIKTHGNENGGILK